MFEEAQLADKALLDFIAHLRDWSRSARMLVLVLSRPDERAGQQDGQAERLELEPLSDAEIDELVAGTVDGAPEALLATIRALVSSRLDRLDRLDSDERQVQFAGAGLGETFTTAGAAAVADMSDNVARRLLDGLVTKAFLELEADADSTAGRYAFVQGVVRRVTLARASRRELKRRHLAAVEHLLVLTETEPELATALAGHLVAAVEADPRGSDVAPIKHHAVKMLRAAADRAAAVGALQEALSLFDRALELTDDEHERAVIFEAGGFVGYRAGETDAATTRYRAAQDLHAAAGRTTERHRVWAMELRAAGYARPTGEVLPAARALYAELGDQSDAVAALAGNVLAYTLYQSGQSEEALRIASRTALIAEERADNGELAFALGVEGSALQQLERLDEAIAVKRRVVAVAEEHDTRRVAPASSNLAVALASIGRYGEAADRAREALVRAERAGERFFERYARLVLGRALCSLGQRDEAVAEIESVKDRVPPFYVAMAIAPLVVIALGRGQEVGSVSW